MPRVVVARARALGIDLCFFTLARVCRESAHEQLISVEFERRPYARAQARNHALSVSGAKELNALEDVLSAFADVDATAAEAASLEQLVADTASNDRPRFATPLVEFG